MRLVEELRQDIKDNKKIYGYSLAAGITSTVASIPVADFAADEDQSVKGAIMAFVGVSMASLVHVFLRLRRMDAVGVEGGDDGSDVAVDGKGEESDFLDDLDEVRIDLEDKNLGVSNPQEAWVARIEREELGAAAPSII